MKFPKLFGKSPEVKESRTGAAIVLTPNQPAWKSTMDGKYALEGYEINVISSNCVQIIAEAVASVNWTVWRGDVELLDHPLLDLMAEPNPAQSGSDYTKAYISHLMISGNAYEEKVEAGELKELYVLKSQNVSVLQGVDGFPSGFEYQGDNGKKIRYDVDIPNGDNPVWQTKLFSPTDHWYGQSPMMAGSRSIDIHTASMDFVQALLQNSARPSGALVHKGEGRMTDEQFGQLKADIEQQYSGPSNAGRPMLLEGGLDWVSMGLSPVDMEIHETKNAAARDIALSFGVPPLMLGIAGDNTYANYKEARQAFWEDTVIPLVSATAQSRTQWLADDGVEVRADMDHIPAIVEKRAARWEAVEASTVLTINEKRKAMGYEKLPSGGDELQDQSGEPLGDVEAKTMARIAGYDAG